VAAGRFEEISRLELEVVEVVDVVEDEVLALAGTVMLEQALNKRVTNTSTNRAKQ
jgi:hypothetical protein